MREATDPAPRSGAACLAELPARLQQLIHQATDLQMLYNKDKHQVTIHVTITDTTPATLACIISLSQPDAPASSDLPPSPMGSTICTANGLIGARGTS